MLCLLPYRVIKLVLIIAYFFWEIVRYPVSALLTAAAENPLDTIVENSKNGHTPARQSISDHNV
jgi:hypothetical protein